MQGWHKIAHRAYTMGPAKDLIYDPCFGATRSLAFGSCTVRVTTIKRRLRTCILQQSLQKTTTPFGALPKACPTNRMGPLKIPWRPSRRRAQFTMSTSQSSILPPLLIDLCRDRLLNNNRQKVYARSYLLVVLLRIAKQFCRLCLKFAGFGGIFNCGGYCNCVPAPFLNLC